MGLAMQGLAAGASRVEQAAPPERVWTPTGWVDPPAGTTPKPAPIAQAEGRLIACDVVKKRLDNIRPRLARAGVEAELIHLGPNGGGVEDIVGTAEQLFICEGESCRASVPWFRVHRGHYFGKKAFSQTLLGHVSGNGKVYCCECMSWYGGGPCTHDTRRLRMRRNS